MNIGIPKEKRPYEFRVGMSPAGVEILAQRGHTIYVEHEAGVGGGFSDQEYEKAGARLVYSAEEVFARADLLLKMARPFKSEIEWLRPGSILAGFLHLHSAKRDKVDVLIEKKITSIAYEQIMQPDGSLPVLRPFSQIGGLMAAQISARLLQNNWGGKGILMGGIPGVPPAEVVIIGGGTVGRYATQGFLGLGAHVTVIDLSVAALQRITDRFPGVTTIMSTPRNIERSTAYADVVVGAVLVPGQRAPILVTREMVCRMKPRSVIIDVSIDEGGCVETSRPTTHEHPTYVEEGITHCAVPNLPGVVARTSTHAFVNAAVPYIVEIAGRGVEGAMADDPAIASGVVTYQGEFRQMTRFSAQQEFDDGLD
jgi:alanine dehydrogenase